MVTVWNVNIRLSVSCFHLFLTTLCQLRGYVASVKRISCTGVSTGKRTEVVPYFETCLERVSNSTKTSVLLILIFDLFKHNYSEFPRI